MKIVSLLENTSSVQELECEHGLSLYIEAANLKILFDMGQSDLFYKNALKLGIDLQKVDIAILSHGHYDHGGGLSKFLEINSTATVYAAKDAFLPYYNGSQKYIGLDSSLKNHSRIKLISKSEQITSFASLSFCKDEDIHFDINPFGLSTLTEKGLVPDSFSHELYLMIEENNKRILFSGCAHRGILNIISSFSPDYFIGGFHLSKIANPNELLPYALELDKSKTIYYTCHCTGKEQYEIMKSRMKRLQYLSTGNSIII